jgi:preprotein translocase subunit SecA
MSPTEWDWELLNKELGQFYPATLSEDDVGEYSVEAVTDRAIENAHKAYAERLSRLPAEARAQLEQQVVLSVIDNKWREHLSEMDYLRSGIGLRAMGQRDPLVEYQREGYALFSELVDAVKRDTVRYLFHVQFAETPAPEAPKLAPVASASSHKGQVGRNDPCPCGSGKKYKRCHGAS